MALPFLPHREIQPMFLRLRLQAQTQPLLGLVEYIRHQWLESTMFLPRNWSVYRQPIRTNNDTEGWHNALNRRAGGQSGLSLYSLVELLAQEARLTAVTTRLVSSEESIEIYKQSSSTAGTNMTINRRPLPSFLKSAPTSMAQLVFTDYLY